MTFADLLRILNNLCLFVRNSICFVVIIIIIIGSTTHEECCPLQKFLPLFPIHGCCPPAPYSWLLPASSLFVAVARQLPILGCCPPAPYSWLLPASSLFPASLHLYSFNFSNWRVPPTLFRTSDFIYISPLKLKLEAIPVQIWTNPEGSRSLWLPQFLDSRHMKIVGLSAVRTGRLNPQELYRVLISASG